MTAKRKKKSAIQLNSPISLPNDGPIHGELNGVTAGQTQGLVPILHLLRDLTGVARSVSFIESMRIASTLKEQLHTLHAYKSWYLDQKARGIDAEDPMLYRILLEWMLSSETPMPLKKALNSTLIRFPTSCHEVVYQSILESLSSKHQFWKDPTSSLFDAIRYLTIGVDSRLRTLDKLTAIVHNLPSFLEELESEAWAQSSLDRFQTILKAATIVEILLNSLPSNEESARAARRWIPYLYELLGHKILPVDHLLVVAIAYARASVLQSDSTIFDQLSYPEGIGLGQKPRIALIQGFVAALEWNQLEPVLVPLTDFLGQEALLSNNQHVRIMAMKALRSIVSRCSSNSKQLPCDFVEIIIGSWERSANKEMSQAIGALFQSVVSMLPAKQLPSLKKRIMDQPPNRKGKYIALEILLPLVGEKTPDSLLHELLTTIGKPGSNNAAIADLWAKLILLAIDWTPSLAKALVDLYPLSQRQKVASLCLPRLSKMPASFPKLLRELALVDKAASLECDGDGYRVADRVLWAQLRVLCLAQRIDRDIRSNVMSSIRVKDVEDALIHVSPNFRLTAMQGLHRVLKCHYSQEEATNQEMRCAIFVLPIIAKTVDHVDEVLECVALFVDRLILFEQSSCEFPRAKSFVLEFLLSSMVDFLGYPGAPAEKETFLLSMLEWTTALASRDLESIDLEVKSSSRSSSLWIRKRSDGECAFLEQVRLKLLGRKITTTLISLIGSRWDGTRARAYKLLSCLIRLADKSGFQYEPVPQMKPQNVLYVAFRMASSPSPRESDSGARLLSALCQSTADGSIGFEDLVEMLDKRLQDMSTELVAILSEEDYVSSGSKLPLTHGIVQAIRLTVNEDPRITRELSHGTSVLLGRLAALLLEGIKLSLGVVADIKDGVSMEGVDQGNIEQRGSQTKRINPGALGANGIFSSVSRVSDGEARRRDASQRIVMGAWLLTREASEALATVLSLETYEAPLVLLECSGTLLLSTLTSLKHTGAAFAAHRAIQMIAQRCFEDVRGQGIQELPGSWAERLLREISEEDRVRDSTLRRSTGYALGFLAILRAECTSRIRTHSLCEKVIRNIIKLALPSSLHWSALQESIDVKDLQEAFSFLVPGDVQHESPWSLPTTRIHALNVLRSIILDAPLAREVYAAIGDAMVVSMMGYTDEDWAVRNSATMVFSSIMLRSIDPIKNAASTDAISRSAASVVELARSYNRLFPFLLAMLTSCTKKTLKVKTGASLPPSLPILLLLARIEPIQESGAEASALVEPFIRHAVHGLEHTDLTVRKASAQALANLSSYEGESDTNICNILKSLMESLESCRVEIESGDTCHWNRLHGVLLAVLELLKKPQAERQLTVDSLRECRFIREHHWVRENNLAIPPLCFAAVTEILGVIREDSSILFAVCKSALVWLEKSRPQPGIGELGLSIGRWAVSCLWHGLHEACQSNLDFDTDALAVFIQSISLDVRLAAVKTLKRKLKHHLEFLSSSRQTHHVIPALSVIVAKGLGQELEEGKRHAPTLRRLSRCLLFCFESARHLEIATDMLKDAESEVLDFLRYAISRDAIAVSDSHAITQLIGNAIELYAFYASDTVTPCSQDSVLRTFDSLLDMGAHPECYWRVRLSVVDSIATQGHRDKLLSQNKVIHLLHLLQDSDDEVRLAAARAARDSAIPEVALSRFIGSMKIGAQTSWLRFITEVVLPMSDQCIETLDEILSETGTVKKIFGKEEHDTYCEPFLILQLLVVQALQFEYLKEVQEDGLQNILNKVLRRCQRMTTGLTGMFDADGDLSRLLGPQAGILVPLHGLFLATALIIWSTESVEGVIDVQLRAKRLQEDTIHLPSYLREILATLCCAKFGDEDTRRYIARCCFLAAPLRPQDEQLLA